MSRRILIRNVKDNNEKVKVLARHTCECKGSVHNSLTAQVIRPDKKDLVLRICENDKGAFVAKKLSGIRIKSDGKHSMQHSIQHTLKSKIAAILL